MSNHCDLLLLRHYVKTHLTTGTNMHVTARGLVAKRRQETPVSQTISFYLVSSTATKLHRTSSSLPLLDSFLSTGLAQTGKLK